MPLEVCPFKAASTEKKKKAQSLANTTEQISQVYPFSVTECNVETIFPHQSCQLQQSMKGGPAKHTIECLSSFGNHYGEAIECLKAKYDHQRLIN